MGEPGRWRAWSSPDAIIDPLVSRMVCLECQQDSRAGLYRLERPPDT